ncbi:hypothetical protein WD repeat protein [Aspergillus fumigatus]|nr:hypothetical protein WD repeat protein [Aspergillus fumigatus]
MHTLKATASSSLNLGPGNYIYSITPASPGSLAAIASDDSLRVFDAAGLGRVAVVAAKTHGNGGVTALRRYGSGRDQQLLVTGGRDGKVKVWDLRAGKGSAAVEMETDGLVNIYDTTITDEDDALVQVINHGSVHHAGFLGERTIYALSHDEDFSVHPATDPDEQAEEPKPIQFGDLRQPLKCEYIAQLCTGSQSAYIAAGHKLDKRLDLVPLIPDPWRFDQANLWRLPGAHGEEVVRSIYVDEQVCLLYSCFKINPDSPFLQGHSVFTGGEDGFVRAWKPVDEDETQGEYSSAKPSRPKEKKREKERFKPY